MTTLAQFLRARREQLQPGDVGLPSGGRRRTPGLRREEVATLAGVSVDYLIRLEQGRDTHPSPSVLRSLADALRLPDDQRRNLGKLAAIGGSPEFCPTSGEPARRIAPTVSMLLDRLGPTPGFVVGAFNDVLAWNDAWERLAVGLGMLDGSAPNLARHVFLYPNARTVYLDWAAAADEQIVRLRQAGCFSNDARLAELVDELRREPEFARRWSAFSAGEQHRGTRRLRHPELGELRLSYEVLLLPDDGDQRLITWLPGDHATAAALAAAGDDDLPVSPAKLRSIG